MHVNDGQNEEYAGAAYRHLNEMVSPASPRIVEFEAIPPLLGARHAYALARQYVRQSQRIGLNIVLAK